MFITHLPQKFRIWYPTAFKESLISITPAINFYRVICWFSKISDSLLYFIQILKFIWYIIMTNNDTISWWISKVQWFTVSKYLIILPIFKRAFNKRHTILTRILAIAGFVTVLSFLLTNRSDPSLLTHSLSRLSFRLATKS